MLMIIILVWIFIACSWLAYKQYFRPYYILKRRLGLPGPPPKFFVGNYSEIAKLGIIKTQAKWMSQYGPTFVYFLGTRAVIATQDIEVIKSIMVKNFDCFCNRFHVPLPHKKGKVTVLPMMCDDQWRNVRQVMTPTFSSKKLRTMIPLIKQRCDKMKSKMASLCSTDVSADISVLFKEYTLEVVLATAFSRDIELDNGKENALFNSIVSIFNSLRRSTEKSYTGERFVTIWSHLPCFDRFVRFIARKSPDAKSWDYLEDTSLKITEDRMNDMKTNNGYAIQDLMQLLLQAKEKEKDTCPLNIDEVVAAVMTTILAGFETTSNTLASCAYVLALNPTEQDKLISEIKNYYDANPDSPLQDAADNIEYVDMVMKEAMRLYPVLHPARECNQTCAVTDNLTIEKGTCISFPLSVLHRNPEYWPDPDKFDPERFNPNKEPTYPTFAYLPFGEGPRYCIGKRHALLHSKMTIVSVFKDFHFKRAPDTEIPIERCQGATVTPVNNIKLYIVPNSN